MTNEQKLALDNLAKSISEYGDAQFMLAIAASRGTNQECFDAMEKGQYISSKTARAINHIAHMIEGGIPIDKD